MKSSVVILVVSFLAGSATTALFLSWDKRESVSASTSVQSNANTEADARLTRIDERLTNIETLLAQSQKQTPSAQVTITEPNKHEDKDTLDAATRATTIRTADAIVEHALQSGTVTPSDFNALAASTVKLSKEEREKLLSKLTVAINTDQVHVDPNSR